MYKYLRDLMDVADLVGDVNDIFYGGWGMNTKRLVLKGNQADGKAFELILELEVEGDGT